MSDKFPLTPDEAEGLLAGTEGKTPKKDASEAYMIWFHVGQDMRRGEADAQAGRLPDGAQSKAWQTGYQLGLRKRGK